MKLNEIYNKAINALHENNVESAEFEAKELIKHFTGYNESGFLLNREAEIQSDVVAMICSALNTRAAGVPLQYILGKWDFMDSTFFVGNGVLIPRPETEQLCEFVIDKAAELSKPVIYDLCSGSGCIGISIKKELENSHVYLIEKSAEAYYYLSKNVENICNGNITAINADIFNIPEFEALPGADVIVSNPPYIKTDELPYLQREVQFEPVMALDGGEDGLYFYRNIITLWKKKLKINGIFAFECGEEQAGLISLMLYENGFDSKILKDYNDIERFVVGRRLY